ncbi:MAG TPA: hypothetical protein VFT16_04200 [Candidatus Saccharimonadales bacterium]|nr:hypothetical protein [Candidatus Saccharimonadales bacterium]
MNGVFYRNVRARDQLELLLLAAATSLLLVRFYLFVTGYPQIGSGGLHIAHMLWGGALMLAALVICLSFLGARALRLGAILGGIGFGVFIDELGKFITRDNDYFYQPTIGLIYAIFIILYLTFNFISRKQPLSSREYQLNALAQMEEAVVHDMNPTERMRVKNLLAQAEQNDPITRQLQKLLSAARTTAPKTPGRMNRLVHALNVYYERFWRTRNSNLVVRLFFLLEVFLFVGSVLLLIYRNLDGVFDLFSGSVPFSTELAIGQLVSSLVAAGFAVYGAMLLPKSHLRAYEQFRRATMVNIFLTEFFMFSRIQFGALPGFVFNLILLAFLGYAMRQELRLESQKQNLTA